MNGVNKLLAKSSRRQTNVQDLMQMQGGVDSNSVASLENSSKDGKRQRQVELNRIVFDDSKFKDFNKSLDHHPYRSNNPAIKPQKKRRQKKAEKEMISQNIITERTHTGEACAS